MLPLQGIRVLDFSTLLPGPFATLLLAEAGAEVLKVERPHGDDMRRYAPDLDASGGAAFALLNRGKKSIMADLNDPEQLAIVANIASQYDVIVEQFRPGVMEKFGLDYNSIRKINPKTIYCSITGYGQDGPLRRKAGHDINYLGDTGLLALSCGLPGARVLPQIAIADLAGGAYPAVVNILLALRQRDISGEGCNIDVSMTDSLFSLMYLPWAVGFTKGEWPDNGQGKMTGASPRYNLYDTRDDGVLVVAALEDKFWSNFVSAIALDPDLVDDARDSAATFARIKEIIRERDCDHWDAVFDGVDCCCTIMRNLSEAVNEPHFRSRLQLERHSPSSDNSTLPPLPIPLAPPFKHSHEHTIRAPILGSSNVEFGLPSCISHPDNS